MSSVEAQGRVAWFWNRLRCMTPAEVAHRAVYAFISKIEHLLGSGALSAEPVSQLRDSGRWIRCAAGPQLLDGSAYLAEAEAVAVGSVRLFASQRYEVGALPQWNRCPLTGVLAPAVQARRLSLTDRALVGDIKYVWELNRHLHWVVLGQAWALSGEAKHLRALEAQLRSWLDQCPYGIGPNWTSSLEYALRLLNWSAVWQLIGGLESPLFAGDEGQALRQRWLDSINLHVRAITKHFSRHSSANNHLVGELAGVFVAAQTWPFWASFDALAKQARRELEREVLLQVAPDGVLREQAFEYATFTFDFFLAVERAAAAAGQPMSPAYLARMRSMCEFISAVTSVKGAVPQVGDADGAEAFRLDPRPGRDCFAAMQQKGAAMFSQAAWLPLESLRRDDVAWLDLPSVGALPAGQPAAAIPRQMDFPDGGYFLFGRDLGGSNEVLGLVDAGPLGYLGIAAHGHADALQVWLSVAGVPVLIDPGTFSYRADKKWRDYFRGTSAHNTIRIAGLDQSVSGGRFMWTRKAKIHDLAVSRSELGDFDFRAWHDGYLRLPSKHRHHRAVSFNASGLSIAVTDRVAGNGAELLELFWHVHPAWFARRENDAVILEYAENSVRLEFKSGQSFDLALLSGQEDDPLGWYSSAYEEKQTCSVIVLRATAQSFEVTTNIDVSTGVSVLSRVK